ncbi:DsrE/DsrF-like family protein [Planctomycetes bacterium Pan216]|uniref:DsrE/DsrF-like family protein n=1 Tax=Kolteria novifilia TaxID=2527975 RepID=A0A518AXR1_9BACT|nr:DsrE/DsrF-like family protein [Planctomycetes bacterium Pan216]
MKKWTTFLGLGAVAGTTLALLLVTGPRLVRAERSERGGEADTAAASAGPKYWNPIIKSHGAVVRYPDAAQQPRDGSKIVVDITRSGKPDVLNSGVEKVARFVNIYEGAGKKPANVDIAIVLHGGATLTALNDEAYASRFGVEKNPHLDFYKELQQAGVKVYLCGQALAAKKGTPEQVADHIPLVTSALVALVNHQADGYAYIPLGN